MVAALAYLDTQTHPDIVAHLSHWMREKALPFWRETGFDRTLGAFHEACAITGEPSVKANRRTRVQARQIYVYSHASVLGWDRNGLDRAFDAFRFLQKKIRTRGPGYAHLCLPNGKVYDAKRDAYDHMFILLAYAWLAKATGEAQVRTALDETMAFIDKALAMPDGGFRECVPTRWTWAVNEQRRQNPHMHAFEAMLALHETLNYPGALERAERLLQLFEQRFFSRETDTLCEYFTLDLQDMPDARAMLVEPGHQAEWVWLLRAYERLTSRKTADLRERLMSTTISWIDPITGLLPDETSRQGPVLLATKRTWPQTELAKAWIAQHEAGIVGARERALQALRALNHFYLDKPFACGWTDRLDAENRPIVERVPASTLYHLFVAIVEADRVLGARSML